MVALLMNSDSGALPEQVWLFSGWQCERLVVLLCVAQAGGSVAWCKP